jgi:hypothetical protein
MLWPDEVLKEIGNALGLFYDVDNSYKDSGYIGMARILVCLELSKGLANSIMIRKGPPIFSQSMNYGGISFKCGQCHFYGYLTKNC